MSTERCFMWLINLPGTVEGGSSRFILNLNNYRNTHYHLLNKAKVTFDSVVADKIKHLPKISKCRISYRLFVKSKRRIDTSNVCAIVDKFFCDTLVNHKKLDDDSYEYVTETRYIFGGIDKDNPRIEAMIIPVGIEQILAHTHLDISTAIQLPFQQAGETYFIDGDQHANHTYSK